jgi:hypothetical protein
MGAAAEEFGTMVNDDILTERYEMLPAVYFAVTTRVIEKGYKEMFDSLFPTLEQAAAAARTASAARIGHQYCRYRFHAADLCLRVDRFLFCDDWQYQAPGSECANDCHRRSQRQGGSRYP